MKRCACGATYTADGWTALPLVTNHNAPSGEIDSAGVRLQFRLCRCGSTLAVALGEDMQGKRLTDAELTERMRDIQRAGLGDHAADLREHIASLTPPTPEDVARDVQRVADVMAEAPNPCPANCECEDHTALDRLASAAALVPGLEVRSTLLAQVVESLGGQEHPPERWPWLAKLKSDGLAEYAAARGRLDTLLETHASDVYGLRTTMNQDGIGWEAMLSEVITRYGRMAALLKASHDVGHLDVPMPERLAVLLAAHDGNCAATRETLAEVTSERDAARQERDHWRGQYNAMKDHAEAQERDKNAAQQEVEALRMQLAASEEAHRGALDEQRRLAARVEELEREKEAAEWRVAEMEAQAQRLVEGQCALTQRADAAERRVQNAADRLTGILKGPGRVDPLELETCLDEVERRLQRATPAPAGLLEAVGPFIPWVEETAASAPPDDVATRLRWQYEVTFGDFRRLRAAYDAAKDGEDPDAEKAAKWDAAVGRAKDTNGIFSAWCVGGFAPKEERVASVLRYLGLTLPPGLDTPPAGPGGGETVEPPHRPGRSANTEGSCTRSCEHESPTPEPTITLAALAAVVESFVNERGLASETLMRVSAREVLRRATGGWVPEVLDKAKVVEVLWRHSPKLDLGLPHEFDRGWDACLSSIASDLGVTLPVTEPSGPPAPRTRRPEPMPEGPALNPVPGFPMPPAAVLEAITKRTRAYHGDRTCGACNGPLETSRDAVCESCAPELLAHTYAESMAPTEPGLSAPSTLEANLKPGSNSTPEVVLNFTTGGPGKEHLRVLAAGALEYETRPGLWVPSVNETGKVLARALAEAKREARKAAESMRERAELVLYEAATQTRHPERRDRLLALGHTIRDLPLEAE